MSDTTPQKAASTGRIRTQTLKPPSSSYTSGIPKSRPTSPTKPSALPTRPRAAISPGVPRVTSPYSSSSHLSALPTRLRTKSTANAPSSPSPSKPPTSTMPPRPRTKSTAKSPSPSLAKPPAMPTRPRAKSIKTPASPAPAKASTPALSIREAIALKRAQLEEAQKPTNVSSEDLSHAIPDAPVPEEQDVLGRKGIRETIESSKSTGSLNLCARDPPLQCIPSALWDIVLGVTPESLTSVEEHSLPPSPTKASHKSPAWYEIQDLVTLKAWNNEIREIQPELSLFGSLKTIDLHNNKLVTLPESFTDLQNLAFLDLSHNLLQHIPPKLWTLTELSYLNISFNSLASLDFDAAFQDGSAEVLYSPSNAFFAPSITRSTRPSPRLVTLEARGNSLTAQSIGDGIPAALSKLDLSENPIGTEASAVQPLLKRFSRLQKLRELRFEKAGLSDSVFTVGLFGGEKEPFGTLELLDLGETSVTVPAVEACLASLSQELRFSGSADDLSRDSIRVVVGKPDLREDWEKEAEDIFARRREKLSAQATNGVSGATAPSPKSALKPVPAKEVVKESWEIEADQGLLTEGGRRKARAQAAAKAEAEEMEKHKVVGGKSSPTAQAASVLASPQYYNSNTHALTLPASTTTKPMHQHARTFSLAGPSAFAADADPNLAIPNPTLPLALIAVQEFSSTLKVLTCNSRRKDRTITLPHNTDSAVLPRLVQLEMEGCQLPDNVPVSTLSEGANPTSVSAPQTTEPILPLITTLFPSLTVLNLSHNMLTSASLTTEIVSALVLASPVRPGLRQLSLRGNRIEGLEGFEELANRFKGNREVDDCKLEELDLRENEIGRLPPVLGLLPLDVFLVEGNIFRVPQRRIWEREGSRGLLSWLRGRIE